MPVYPSLTQPLAVPLTLAKPWALFTGVCGAYLSKVAGAGSGRCEALCKDSDWARLRHSLEASKGVDVNEVLLCDASGLCLVALALVLSDLSEDRRVSPRSCCVGLARLALILSSIPLEILALYSSCCLFLPSCQLATALALFRAHTLFGLLHNSCDGSPPPLSAHSSPVPSTLQARAYLKALSQTFLQSMRRAC